MSNNTQRRDLRGTLKRANTVLVKGKDENPSPLAQQSSRRMSWGVTPLLKMKSLQKADVGFFGGIAFPEAPRAPAAKYVRVSKDADEMDVIDILLKTWKLPPPCAMLSMSIDEGETRATNLVAGERLDEVLRRGIAETMIKTNAWVITNGDASSASVQAVGRSVRYGISELASDWEGSPCIGVVAWEKTREHEQLAELPIGMIHKYGPSSHATPSGGFDSKYASIGQNSRASRSFTAAGDGDMELDPNHTHFIMVEGTAEDAACFRARLERFISLNDISQDEIQTPKVVVVVGGDVATLEHVYRALDPDDEATGAAVPCLVVADSGGAAEDIYRHYRDPTYLPKPGDGGRTKAYCEGAAKLLPDVVEKGRLTGNNASEQLCFFSLGADNDSTADFALEAQKALLNDCPNVVEEALLAVAWGEPAILEHQLHENAKFLISDPEARDSQAPVEVGRCRCSILRNGGPPPDLLQVALIKGDKAVVRCLLEFIKEQPSTVALSQLFTPEFNRYKLSQYKGSWSNDHAALRKHGSCTSVGLTQESTGGSSSKKEVMKWRLPGTQKVRVAPPESTSDGDIEKASAERSTGASDSHRSTQLERGTSSVKLSNKRTHELLGAFGNNSRSVLSKMVDGYRANLDARLRQARLEWLEVANQMTKPRYRVDPQVVTVGSWMTVGSQLTLSPMWTDLMMWAVLAGRHSLAAALWEKTTNPLRAALMASQLCRRLALEPSLRPDHEDLLTESASYEDMATDLLDAIRESEDALPILSLIPWAWTEDSNGDSFRMPLWESSPIESAAHEDGLLSVPCRKVVAHRHSQYLLDRYATGCYPGSHSCIPQHASPLLMIALQACLPFLPGTLVEVMPNPYLKNMMLHGEQAAKEGIKQRESLENFDPDLIEAVEEMTKQMRKEGAIKTEGAHEEGEREDTLEDIAHDLMSGRFIAFYSIPKVKFTLHLVSHCCYMFFLASFLLGSYDHTHPEISWHELIFWMWTCTRALGECYELDGFTLNAWRMYVRDTWNKVDLLQVVVTSVTAVFRLIYAPSSRSGDHIGRMLAAASVTTSATSAAVVPTSVASDWHSLAHMTPRCLYMLVAILTFFRILQFLRFYEKVGVLTIVLEKMLVDIALFLVILVPVWAGFAVGFAAILPRATEQDEWYNWFGGAPIWYPAWGVHGDFSTTNLLREVDGEYPTAVVAPTMLWIYQFIATVIMVNLLIAQMADTYSNITSEGQLMWLFERTHLIEEYKDTKRPLPPPFNVLCFAWNMVSRRIQRTHETYLEGGFKLLPRKKVLQVYQLQEMLALRKCLEERQAREKESVPAKLRALDEKMDQHQDLSRKRFESLNGRLDKILGLRATGYTPVEPFKADGSPERMEVSLTSP